MARKIVRALVKPEILLWARKSAGFELDEVATGALSKLPQWEAGELKPTIGQLRALAKKYERPLAVFYLQEVPLDFQTIADFRRPPDKGMQRISPRLHLQVRAARERREIALDLLQESGDETPELTISATLDDDPEVVGARVRRFLGVDDDEQRGAWRDKRKAFDEWRSLIEAAGALVFQFDKVETSEASGFALSHTRLPVIAVNRADQPARRSFSLLHEFAHLLLSKSGVSQQFDIDTTSLPPETQNTEIWCNAVAAAALLPRTLFMGEERVRDHEKGDPIWTDDDINALASIFTVSRISILRRLLTLELTDRSFYKAKEAEYARGYAEFLERKKASSASKRFGGRNMPYEAFSLLGRSFIRMVLTPYHNDRITLRDVSDYLNLKTDHIPRVERILFEEAA